MFKTKITEMLGIECPIIEGGMVRVGTGELAAAVSNAGGLGMISSHDYPSREQLRSEIRKTRSPVNRQRKWHSLGTIINGHFRVLDKLSSRQ